MGDRGFVDICCMPCCYYKSEATFQASAHSELSCTGKEDNRKYKLKNLKNLKREELVSLAIFKVSFVFGFLGLFVFLRFLYVNAHSSTVTKLT